MVDVARLAVKVDSTDMPKGKRHLREFAAEGKRTEAQIVKSADRMERELAQTAIAAQNVSKGFNKNGLRMASMQLSQVGQQTMATGNFIQSLAIQLPDLALGFGAVGIMGGVAAGVLLQMAPALLGVGDNSEEAAEALSTFAEGVEDYRSASELATMSTVMLREEFGAFGDELRGTLGILQQLALSRALDGMRVAVEQIDVERLRTLVTVFNDGAGEISIVSETYNRALAALRDEYELTGEQASKLLDGLNKLGGAQGPEEISTAIRYINETLLDTFGTVQNIPPVLREMLQHLAETDVAAARLLAGMEDSAAAADRLSRTDIATNIGIGANEAHELADWLGISLSRALALAATTPMMADEDALMSQQVIPDAASRAAQQSAVVNFDRLTAPRKTRGGRGGISSAARDAQKAQNNLDRERERILEGLKTAQDKYNDSLEQAKRLLDAGVLSQEEYNAQIRQLGRDFQDQLPFVSEFKDSMIDAAMGGVDAFDSLRDAIARAGLEYLFFGTGKFAPDGGGGWGGLFTGLLPSFDGGGFTGTGSRTGGMDGKGGTLAMVHPNETVVDHTKGQSMGGVSKVELIVRNEPGTVVEIARNEAGAAIRQAAPSVVSQSVAAAQKSFVNGKANWTPR